MYVSRYWRLKRYLYEQYNKSQAHDTGNDAERSESKQTNDTMAASHNGNQRSR